MCTAVTYKTKDFYFGRTLDYEFSYCEEVTVTPRNYPFRFRTMGTMGQHYAMIGMAFVQEDYPLYYDAVNEKGLQFYDDLVEELLKNGIEPWITLYHWDLPSALQDKGGWLNRDIVKTFGRYASVIAQRFKGRVTKYMTINEPQCVAQLGYLTGAHAPGWKLSEEKVAQVYHHICLAHSEAQRVIKSICGNDTLVGAVPCGSLAYPEKETPENIEASYHASFQREADPVVPVGVIVPDVAFLRE